MGGMKSSAWIVSMAPRDGRAVGTGIDAWSRRGVRAGVGAGVGACVGWGDGALETDGAGIGAGVGWGDGALETDGAGETLGVCAGEDAASTIRSAHSSSLKG